MADKGMEELLALNTDVDTINVEFRQNTKEDSVPEYDGNKERGVWGSKFEFLLAIVGYTVGIGSVWRFPIICSRNGGGAFLIPFYFFLIISGGPLYYLEVCLGQFTGKSAGLAFEFCPLLKGLGFLQVALSVTVQWYLVMVMVWVFYFFYSSFFPVLPWSTCDNWWNTPHCQVFTGPSQVMTDYFNNTTSPNITMSLNQTFEDNITEKKTSAAFEFWEYNVIRRSAGLEDMGQIQIHLLICLFLSWLFIVLAVIKGVKTLGKVVYVTATAPFVLLTVMLIRGITLDGAIDGIIFYLKPDFSRLLDMQVWLEAAIQVFYSLGPSWGGVITMASYNKFHQKSHVSTMICVVTSGFASFYNGMVVFSIIGFIAKESGATVKTVAQESGPGLVFVAFPTALNKLPFPQLWSVLFFLTLITVVFDSMFGMLETVASAAIDFFPRQLLKRRVLINILTGLFFFLTGIPLTMNGGIYLFQLSDWYFSQFALLVGSGLEAYSICWIYGVERFSQDISLMTGRSVSVLVRVSWGIISPIFLLITLMVMLSQYSTPAYGDGYVYEEYAIFIGVLLGLVPVIVLVVAAFWQIAKTPGNLTKRIKFLLLPSSRWTPQDPSSAKSYHAIPYQYEPSLRNRILIRIRGTKETPWF